MIGPISGLQNSKSQEQEVVLIELEPRPRWPRYTLLLILAGLLGAVAGAYYYLHPVSIGQITGFPSCDQSVSTWGIVTVVRSEEPGFDEIDGDRRGYWIKDTNELGLESDIAVFYDPEKSSAPAVGQSLKVGGILECDLGSSPESVAIIERYRRLQ